MSAETSPLNPDPTDPVDEYLDRETRKKRDPLYLLIFYTLSLAVSIGGFVCATWGYIIVRNAPFDEYNKQRMRDSYEKYFIGMESVWILLGVNAIWTALNLRAALKGTNNELWPFNMVYDFGIWAMLIAFGVLNMIEALWDRRLCDGHWENDELYKKCDIEMFRLLVVELVAVNLGILAAILHFILLVARCCTQGRRNDITIARMLKARIREEEYILLGLVERRAQLLHENEALETGAGFDRPLPPVPVEIIDGDIDNIGSGSGSGSGSGEEDLIDMAAEGSPMHAPESSRVDVDIAASIRDSVPGVQITPPTPTKST